MDLTEFEELVAEETLLARDDVTVEGVCRLLAKLERSAHKRGWDQPSQLLAVVARGRSDGRQEVALRALPHWSGDLPPNTTVGTALRNLAAKMVRGDANGTAVHAAMKRAVGVGADVIGVVLLCEAYRVDMPSNADLKYMHALRSEGRCTNEHPRSYEDRTALALLSDGATVHVRRRRGAGQPPKVAAARPHSAVKWDGDMTDGLCALLTALSLGDPAAAAFDQHVFDGLDKIVEYLLREYQSHGRETTRLMLAGIAVVDDGETLLLAMRSLALIITNPELTKLLVDWNRLPDGPTDETEALITAAADQFIASTRTQLPTACVNLYLSAVADGTIFDLAIELIAQAISTMRRSEQG